MTANGTRFHVAEAGPDDGSAPLVLLLHGFPQCWTAWAHQLPALAAAGYRVAAADLRGFGASDKPPRGYDTPTLAADAAGVVRALGASRAVVVGTGCGGWIAWSMPALQPASTAAVAVLGAPHPRTARGGAPWRSLSPAANRALARMQVPVRPERGLRDGTLVRAVLTEWGAPGWATDDVVAAHAAVMRVPFTAHAALEHPRWVVRSAVRGDGRAFLAALTPPVAVPVLQLHGEQDGAVPLRTARASAVRVAGSYRWGSVGGAGHFLSEEAPEETTEALLDWLATL